MRRALGVTVPYCLPLRRLSHSSGPSAGQAPLRSELKVPNYAPIEKEHDALVQRARSVITRFLLFFACARCAIGITISLALYI